MASKVERVQKASIAPPLDGRYRMAIDRKSTQDENKVKDITTAHQQQSQDMRRPEKQSLVRVCLSGKKNS